MDQLWHYIGILNCYHRVLLEIVKVLLSVTTILVTKHKLNRHDILEAPLTFAKCKQILADEVQLVDLLINTPIHLVSDI